MVRHALQDLQKLNEIEPHIIVLDGEEVAAYILTMTKTSKADISQLVPMFLQIDDIDYEGKKVSKYDYLVVGHVGIGKIYRGAGLFDQCYRKFQ